jgi:hypothetical protein
VLTSLQGITVADITMADGKKILPEVFEGSDLQYRTSTLQWPCQDILSRPCGANGRLF